MQQFLQLGNEVSQPFVIPNVSPTSSPLLGGTQALGPVPQLFIGHEK